MNNWIIGLMEHVVSIDHWNYPLIHQSNDPFIHRCPYGSLVTLDHCKSCAAAYKANGFSF